MARIPRRLLVDRGSTNHCTWRSHNSTHVFELDTAKQFFLDLIKKYAGRYGIQVRSYCLMGTHPHLVVVATKGQAEFSRFWQVVNHLFARWYNRQQKSRRGQVVTQRMKSPLIQPGANGRHVLAVMRYGDLNPVRAGMVRSPNNYDWSSYRHYAYGHPNDLIDDEPEYLALGRTARERRIAYRHLFSTPLTSGLRTRRPDMVDAPFYGDPGWIELHAPLAAGPPSFRCS